MPQHLRVVFMSTCAVVWGGYISYVVHRWSWVIPSVRILKKKITGRWWLDVSWHWPKQAQLAKLGEGNLQETTSSCCSCPSQISSPPVFFQWFVRLGSLCCPETVQRFLVARIKPLRLFGMRNLIKRELVVWQNEPKYPLQLTLPETR